MTFEEELVDFTKNLALKQRGISTENHVSNTSKNW